MVMDTPSSFIAHEHPVVGVEECLDLLGHFSCLLSCLNWLVERERMCTCACVCGGH
jgi:hypothetical protein